MDSIINTYAERIIRVQEIPGRLFVVNYAGTAVYSAERKQVEEVAERERTALKFWLRELCTELLDKMSTNGEK